MSTVLAFMLKFISSDTFKEVIKYGLKKIVASTNTNIDDELVGIMFENIIKSDGNKISEIITK